jgi:hypothetical protein
MEVVKIRLQAQQHSLADPLEVPRYRNAAHAAYTIVREEGFSTLYRGVSLTALRQATNQGMHPIAQAYSVIGTNYGDVLQAPTLQPTKNSKRPHRNFNLTSSTSRRGNTWLLGSSRAPWAHSPTRRSTRSRRGCKNLRANRASQLYRALRQSQEICGNRRV